MCVTKHLAAMVRTVRHLKFLSRNLKQERFFWFLSFFFFVAISFNCINVQHTHFLNRYYGNFPLAIWWRVILAGCFCACGYRGSDLIESKGKSALYQMRIDFDHDDDHSTLPQLTFDMSFDHLKMKILSLTAIRFFSLSLGCIIYFARFFLLAAFFCCFYPALN